MINFGPVPAGSVLPVFFSTYGGTSGESITLSGLAVTDIEIYKGVSITQRSSDAGYALIDTDGIDVDGITGIHAFSIDTGDNTDAGFYAAGSFYTVVVSAVTVDGQTVNFIAATFSIRAAEHTAGYPVVTIKDGTGTGEIDTTSGGVLVAAIAANAITASAIADNAIDAGAIAADAITAAKIADGAIDANTFAAGAITANAIAADAIGASELAADAVTEIQSGLATAANLATVAGYLDTEIAAILADTNELQTDWVDGGRLDLILDARASAASVAALNNLSAAQVNAEVLDVLNTDTFAEPGQEAPGATVSLVKKIGYLYKFLRNKKTQTSTTFSLFADDASTVDQKATISDDGVTFTSGEVATGP